MRKKHPLAGKKAIELRDVADFPWVFFERKVHPILYDGILRRMQEENLHPRIQHQVTHADQVPVILPEDSALAWLTPAGADRIIGDGLIAIPLRDPEIRLEIHMATLAANKSPLISEYVRSFVRRVEEDRGPIQLALPTAFMKRRARAAAKRFLPSTEEPQKTLCRAHANEQTVKFANQCDSNNAPESGLPLGINAVG